MSSKEGEREKDNDIMDCIFICIFFYSLSLSLLHFYDKENNVRFIYDCANT